MLQYLTNRSVAVLALPVVAGTPSNWYTETTAGIGSAQAKTVDPSTTEATAVPSFERSGELLLSHEELEALADRSPPPPEWFDEPLPF